METQEVKCVMVIDNELPAGFLANTAAILGISLGRQFPECVGNDVEDASGFQHRGIISIPVPVLKGTKEILKNLRKTLYTPEYHDVWTIDFSDVAQCCNVYSEYTDKAENTTEEDHTYLGIALYGNKKKINKLTGSMPLLR